MQTFVVRELKYKSEDGESQNIEQMIGIWRQNQTAMLGFTCNPEAFLARVLLWVKDKMIIYLLLMDNASTINWPMAFASFFCGIRKTYWGIVSYISEGSVPHINGVWPVN